MANIAELVRPAVWAGRGLAVLTAESAEGAAQFLARSWPEAAELRELMVIRGGAVRPQLRFLGRDEVALSSAAWRAPGPAPVCDVLERTPSGEFALTQLLGGDVRDALWDRGFGVRILDDVGDDVPEAELWRPQQSSQRVFMVRPLAFESNPLAAEDNAFMKASALEGDALRRTVVMEHDGLQAALLAAGVSILSAEHAPEHGTPDAVFPNNWFSTHAATPDEPAKLVLYPLKPLNRRGERRPDLLALLRRRPREEIDLSGLEQDASGECVEGTGSLVLDRVRRIAFLCLSERSTRAAAEDWAARMGYRLVAFSAVDAGGAPIYHTNVMLAVGSTAAIVCLESIRDAAERAAVAEALAPLALVDISLAQVSAFCGNCLEVRNGLGEPLWAMSDRAREAFTPEQREVLGAIVSAPIPTIEDVGGGGVRCTLSEVF